jgi:spermidine/putrescine transport system ATP-binding protein
VAPGLSRPAQGGVGSRADAPQGTPDVELRSVTKRFGAIIAVDNIDLAIRNGEFISLLGPSGCGKTTTLRMIAGFEHPDEGELLIGGRDAVGTPPYRRDVNMVFQAYALFPHMSVIDNVAYGLKQRGMSKRERHQRAGEALELVRLVGRDRYRPTMLSGGQQQRVALARALVMNPRVLLLDEPLGALDLKLRKGMQIELKRIQHEVGITFIYVTHDQEEALAMSDRIAVMSNGIIEQLDEPEAIYDRPLTAFVADFIGDMNFIEAQVSEVRGSEFFATATDALLIHGRGAGSPGEHVRIGIRPERIVAHTGAAPTAPNTASGEVETKIYLGDQIQLLTRLASGETVIVREQRTSADPALDSIQAGDRVALSWDASAPLILRDATIHGQGRTEEEDERQPGFGEDPRAELGETEARLPHA